MIKKLEDIERCHVCGGGDLVPRTKIPVTDLFTDEEILRDVLFCIDCETIHYMDSGTLSYEFSYKIGQPIGTKIPKI